MRAAAAAALLATTAGAGFSGTTVAGPASVLGGPITTNYDLPLHAILLPDGSVRGYTGNAETYLAINGTSVADVVPGQVPVGLGPGPNITDLDHCGAWLNGAWVDTLNRTCDGSAASPPIVHGYYHEEFNCDYARGFFTNKSIAYAVSCDGGLTFSKPGYPGNAIIEGANFSSTHQCGNGDHGVVQFGDDFLHLYFLEWDGWHDDPQIAVARAPITSGGVPGSWTKYCSGAFGCPGIGGNSDMIANMTGTYVMPWTHDASGNSNASGGLAAFGLFGSGYPTLSFSDDGLHWQPAPLPVTVVEPTASWNRSLTPSLELYGYWSMTGVRGTTDTSEPPFYAWATYWPPGSVERYLVRRQVDALDHVTVECAASAGASGGQEGASSCAPPRVGGSYASPPALLTLSQYVYTGSASGTSTGSAGVAAWATTGVVLPEANYTLATATMAYVLPLDASAWYGGNGTLVALHDCYTAVNVPPGSGLPPVDHWVALDGECIGNATTTSPRRIGWTWATPFDSPVAPATTSNASAVGGTWPTAITFLGQLTRCRDVASGYHYVTFNDATCSTAPGGTGGGTPEAALGFAYAPLQVVAPPPLSTTTPHR